MKKTLAILFLAIFIFFIASGSLALAQSGTTSSSGFPNPLGNTDSVEGVLGNIYNYLVTYVVGPLAVIFIVVGGIMYMISGGNKEMAERAKKTIIYAIAGMSLVVVSAFLYSEIKSILGGGGSGSKLQDILTNTLKFLLSIVGFLAIISIVIGSIWMFTAGGNEERYELGKKTATYSILGLTIAVASLVIATQIKNLITGG
jgi:uncharacterized membrane protein